MNIENLLQLKNVSPGDDRHETIRREKTAEEFEELFARHLVREMTKNTFEMADNNGGLGQANSMYREFVTDTLAGKLASQRQLGMADLVTKYWNSHPGLNEKDENRPASEGPVELNDKRTENHTLK